MTKAEWDALSRRERDKVLSLALGWHTFGARGIRLIPEWTTESNELATIRQRWVKVTTGRWEYSRYPEAKPEDDFGSIKSTSKHTPVAMHCEGVDGRAMAAAKEDIAYLLKEVERLTRLLDIREIRLRQAKAREEVFEEGNNFLQKHLEIAQSALQTTQDDLLAESARAKGLALECDTLRDSLEEQEQITTQWQQAAGIDQTLRAAKAEKERDALRAIIDAECPIGALTLAETWRTENAMMQEQVEGLAQECEQLRTQIETVEAENRRVCAEFVRLTRDAINAEKERDSIREQLRADKLIVSHRTRPDLVFPEEYYEYKDDDESEEQSND